ncbi:MAG: hypothetical protein JSS11_16140 [Verrucomicrobia bacterium]|nr:hypothetical protein [Verrucomicrobiota bacterium]
MAKKRNIGLSVFFAGCTIYGRTAFLAPNPEELRNEVVAEDYHAFGADRDSLGVLHGLRFYILGVGVVGLGVALEDYYAERAKK